MGTACGSGAVAETWSPSCAGAYVRSFRRGSSALRTDASICARRHWAEELGFPLATANVGRTPSLTPSPFLPIQAKRSLQFWPSSFYPNASQEAPDSSSSSLDPSLFTYTLHSPYRLLRAQTQSHVWAHHVQIQRNNIQVRVVLPAGYQGEDKPQREAGWVSVKRERDKLVI